MHRGGRICATILEMQSAQQVISARKQILRIAQPVAEAPTNLLEMSIQLLVNSWFRKQLAHKREFLGFDKALKRFERSIGTYSFAA